MPLTIPIVAYEEKRNDNKIKHQLARHQVSR